MQLQRLLAIVSVVAVTVAPLCTQSATGRRAYVDRERGFRVDRPEKGWRIGPVSNSGATLTVRIRPVGGSGTVEASLRAQPAGRRETAAEIQRRALKVIAGQAGYSKVLTTSARVDGRDCRGVAMEYVAPSKAVYVVHQHYVVAYGMRYTLQFHAPEARWNAVARDFSAIRDSVRWIKPNAKAMAQRIVTTLAARCGSEIQWAGSFSDAAKRAAAEKKLVLVQVRTYPGFTLPDPTPSLLYSYPDIVELIGERFVPLRLTEGMKSPMRSQRIYGMSPSTFGQAILLTTSDGEVLHETSAIHPQSVYEFLVDALARVGGQKRFMGATRPELIGVELARWHLRRGELGMVPAALEGTVGASVHRVRASLFRRQRRGDEALSELEKARRLDWTNGVDSEAGSVVSDALEEVVVLLRMARHTKASRVLDRHLRRRPESAKRPEVMFWKGVCEARRGRTGVAASWWKRLMENHPDDRWAWQAAAMAAGGANVNMAWPAPEVLASMRYADAEPLRADSADRVASAAVAYLLKNQRPDGSWISPGEVLRVGIKAPHPFTSAVTAICGRSLLQRESAPGCVDAVSRAIEFCIRAHDAHKKHPPARSYMDYMVWSRAFVLWFFADCLSAGRGDQDEIRARMEEIVRDLACVQKPNGGWSYYVTGNLSSTATASRSISFVTASVLMALICARDVQVHVPPKMISDGQKSLAAMRMASGTFAYFLMDDGKRLSSGRAGAAGRGPACELALLRAGVSDVTRIRRAVATFMKYRRGLAKEVGKVLMHAGPAGQGCHYPMFDYAFAAEAVSLLPEPERQAHRGRLLELLMATRSNEGAFRDTQFNGWDYGTGMALLALRALEVP